MKKILSVILLLAVIFACFNLGISFVSASQNVTNSVLDENLLDEQTSTFESGETSWTVVSKGDIKVVDNPKGEGNVIKYTHTGEYSDQSPAFNLRPFVTKPGRIYISFDLYSPVKNIQASYCVRTDTANILSACDNTDGTRGSLFSSNDYINNKSDKSDAVNATSGAWQRFEYVIDITQEDIDNAGGVWMLCFDKLNTTLGADDVIYIDNVGAYYSDHNVKEKTEIVRDNYTQVGTVRWDAYSKSKVIPDSVTDSELGNYYTSSSQVARVLSPAKYHYRAPFFANITEDGKIAFPEYTMETWEQEALYAHEAGLDYFSYIWYDSDKDMSTARKMHLQSENKNLIKMSGILEKIRLAPAMFELFDAMKDSCWLRVSGRPVLFLYGVNETNWTAEQVREVRQMAYRAGVQESLYIIGMNTDYDDFDAKIYDRDMDAVTLYSFTADKQGEPYDDYTVRLEKKLKAMLDADPNGNHQVVPFFSTGFDARPRIEKKVSWIEGDPNATTDAGKPFGNKYTTELDVLTFKEHFANVYNLTQKYTEKTQPNLVFSYAWNEHDEGGWLCPTLNCTVDGRIIETEPINTERLDTLRKTLDELRQQSYVTKPTADPDAIKTIYNGNAESGIDNWGIFNAGSIGYVQPGANNTKNAIRFIPSTKKGIHESISFNIAPAIINDADYNLKGCGVGCYKVSFYAKAGEIPSESNAIFSVGLTVDSIHKTSDELIQYLSKNYGVGTYKSYGTITLTSQWQKYTINIDITKSYLQMLKELRTGIGVEDKTLTAHPQANKAYDILLRLDGANNGFKNGSYEYFIDELTIEYSADNSTFSKPYPTPTAEAFVPEITPAPTAIPQNKVSSYLEYEIKEDSAVITGSKMDIHGDITIPDTIENLPVTEISEGAFKYRAQITKITLPDCLQTIGDFAFEKCINLKTVVMGEKVKSIGAHAFCGATKLTGDFVITKDITEIKPFTFYKCENIKNAQYLGSKAYFENNVSVKENNGNVASALSFKPNSIEGATLNIGSSLNIDYYAFFEADSDRVTMRFTNENGVNKTVSGVYDEAYKLYRFTYTGINPQCMTDSIKAELLLDGETVLAEKESYSVKEYCDSLASKEAGEIPGVNNVFVLRKLLADTLVYGKEAQLKQDYKLDDPADASDWVKSYKTSFVSPKGVKIIEGNKNSKNYVKSASLNMANVNRIYFRFVITDETVIITLNNKVVDKNELVEQKDGSFILYSEDIKATEFDKVFTLKLIKGEETLTTVQYNLNAYIQSKYSSSSVGPLVQALNNYGVSAKTYQSMLNGTYDGDYDLDDEDVFPSDNTFTGKYSVTPLSTADSAETEGACVPIEKPVNGEASQLDTLIPLESANFDNVKEISETEWKQVFSSVKLSLDEGGFAGNCLHFSKDVSQNAHTAMIDIAPYIKEAGVYTIRFKFKVIGADNSNVVFAGVIRTDSKTSFTPDRADNQTLCGTGSAAAAVKDDTWYLYTGQFSVQPEDIGAGGKWRLGLQSIQEGVSDVYIDEVELCPLTYEDEATPVTKARTWIANELTIISSKTYDDAFNDVDVDLVLTNGNVTYTIPGFWDGGNVWRVRFVCTSAGEWTYTTNCTDKTNTGLHNQTGKITCTDYTGNLEIYKRGFLKIQKDTRYFSYADGTPFFYLGDTHWGLGRETLAMVKETVKTRAEQGYTVYQSEPIGSSFDFTDGVSIVDIAGLRANDKKFQAVANYGLVHANASHFFPNEMQTFIDNHGGYSDKKVGMATKKGKLYNFYEISDEAKSALEKISRYWVARYSAYPVIWTLAQEVDNDNFWVDLSDMNGHEKWGLANNPYPYVAEYMAKYDPYKSPLTAHQEGSSMTTSTNSAFREIKAHTWWASQWKPSLTGDFTVLDRAAEYYNNGQGKPYVVYESYYCMLQTKNFGARAQGYMGFLSGFCGYGYGAQGGWLYNGSYVADKAADDGVDVVTIEQKAAGTKDWKGALKLESSIQMGYMRRFFTDKVGDWYNLVPRFSDTSYLSRAEGAYAVMASKEDGSKAVIYFYNFSDTTIAEKPNATESAGTATGTLKKLTPNTTYNYVWFNPITGKITEQGTFKTTAAGAWDIPEKATCDMVLYVYK